MADDKKKNVLLEKLFGKDRRSAESEKADETELSDKLTEPNDEVSGTVAEDDYTPEWLTEAAAGTAQDPDEDISEALAELFGDTETESTEEMPIFAIPGFEELSAASETEPDSESAEVEDTDGVHEEYVEADSDGEPTEYADEPFYAEDNAQTEESASAEGENAVDAENFEYDEVGEEEDTLADDTIAQDHADEPASASVDADTATLLAALGYSDANAASVKQKAPVKEKTRSRAADLSLAYGYDGKEYSARSQTASVKSAYASDRFKMIVRLGATALFAILLCVYDVFGKKFGGALDATVYPVVNIMISLQLLLIAAAFSVKRLIAAVDSIFKGEPDVHSVSAVALVIVVIYDVILALAAPAEFTLYNFPAAVCLLLSALHDYFVLEREICTFDRLSSWQSIATLERLDASELAAELGEGCVGDSAETVGQAFRMRKGDFAENYFNHVNRKHPMSKMLAFFLTPAVALAFVMFFISLASDNSFAQAANAFAGVALFSLPAFMLISMSFPFYMLVVKNLGSDSVILNESDVAEHRRVDTVVFEESDLFDDNSLTINRISVCDKNRMQDVFDIMCGVSAMYNIIGGRIAGVFRASTSDGDVPEDVAVISVEDGGFEGMAAGKHYCVGSDAYLTSKGISVMRYYDDKYIASNPGGIVLHIAVDGAEVFKLYLTYSISPNTLSVINALGAAKTRIIMRTIDPNVDLNLVSRILAGSFDGKLTLVRKPFDGTSRQDQNKNEGTVEGGILVNGDSAESVLDTVRACRLFGAFSKLNFTVGIAVFAVGALFAFLLGVIGAIVGLPSVYLFIFQIASIFPCVFLASVYLNK